MGCLQEVTCFFSYEDQDKNHKTDSKTDLE